MLDGEAGNSLPVLSVSWAHGTRTLDSVFGSRSLVTLGLSKGDLDLCFSSALGFIQPSIKTTGSSQQTPVKLFWHLAGLEEKMEGV